MSTFFISDLHFGHKNIAIHRGFANSDEMDAHIITEWNKVVHKRDSVYILGDITMEKADKYHLLAKLSGEKTVVLGNHDLRQHVIKLLPYVIGIAGMINYKNNFILTHCPIHPTELRFKERYNIHGHNHDTRVLAHPMVASFLGEADKRYINVSVDQLNYTPIEFNELKRIYCKDLI